MFLFNFSVAVDDEQVVNDLIDDNPIEEDDSGSDEESDGSHRKRKKSDDEDELPDRLDDDDYDLIEANTGVKVQRVWDWRWPHYLLFCFYFFLTVFPDR